MERIAIQHMKEQYKVDLVVERHKVRSKDNLPSITFYGRSKQHPAMNLTITIENEGHSIAIEVHDKQSSK